MDNYWTIGDSRDRDDIAFSLRNSSHHQGIKMDKDVRAGVVAMFCGFVGIILAAIEKTLYDEGIVIDEFVTGSITLPDLMALTIIIWLLIGVVFAVSAR